MSLSQAVTEIVEQMEADVVQGTPILLTAYIRQLRTALKAADTDAVLPISPDGIGSKSLQALQRKLAEKGAVLQAQDAQGVKMFELVGGPAEDGDMISMGAAAPVGCKAVFAAAVFVLHQDGRLHYSEEETEKWKARQS